MKTVVEPPSSVTYDQTSNTDQSVVKHNALSDFIVFLFCISVKSLISVEVWKDISINSIHIKAFNGNELRIKTHIACCMNIFIYIVRDLGPQKLYGPEVLSYFHVLPLSDAAIIKYVDDFEMSCLLREIAIQRGSG